MQYASVREFTVRLDSRNMYGVYAVVKRGPILSTIGGPDLETIKGAMEAFFKEEDDVWPTLLRAELLR